MKLMNRVPEDRGVLLLSVGVFSEEEMQLQNGKSLADFSRTAREDFI